MGALLLVAVVVGLAILAKFLWERSATGKSSSAIKNWPGPPRQPIVGNSLQFKKGAALIKQFMDWSGRGWYQDYGSPMRISFGPVHGVHIFKPHHVEIIMKSLTNTRKSREYNFLKEWLGDGLLISTGEKWLRRRKLLTPTFHFAILKDFMGVFNEQTRILVRVLKEKAKATAPGEAFDICPFITRSTLDIICETAMGATMNAQEKTHSPYVSAIQEFADLGNLRTMRPWLWPNFVWNLLLWYPYGRRWNQILAILHGFTNSVIDRRMKERAEAKANPQAAVEAEDEAAVSSDPFAAKKKRRAFLDLLLEMSDQGSLSREDIREEVDTFMFEGHDTTAHAIMWAVYSFARHPEFQSRAREEVEAVLGDRVDIRPEDLTEMTFLDMCLKESQRIWPSVPMIIRELDEPLVLDESHTVPAKTSLFVNIFSLHRQAEIFPKPTEFDPDRWLPEATKDRHPFAFVPFSAGQRNCIGQKFAWMELKTHLAQLLRHFQFRSSTPEAEMEPAFTLILRPENGVNVTLTPIKE